MSLFDGIKRKLIATNMMILMLFICTLLGSIYILMDSNGKRIIEGNLNQLINTNRLGTSGSAIGRGPGANEAIFIYGNNYSEQAQYQTALDIEEDVITQLVEKANLEKRPSGFFFYEGSLYAFETKQNPMTYNMVLISAENHQQTMSQLLLILILLGVMSLVVLFFFVRFFTNNTIKPVEEAFVKQKQFITDASHELKTPLAVIQTNLDVIAANGQEQVCQQQKWMDHIHFQMNRISGLLNNMLYLARMNDDGRELRQHFDLSHVINNQLISFEAVAFERDIQLIGEIQQDIWYEGNPEEMIQLVGILVDNGIKYSYPNTIIKVTMDKINNKLVLKVINQGDVIDKEHQLKIFERFYQVDQARSGSSRGYGLGLSIAKSIVERHHGKITVHSQDHINTFTVTLPM